MAGREGQDMHLYRLPGRANEVLCIGPVPATCGSMSLFEVNMRTAVKGGYIRSDLVEADGLCCVMSEEEPVQLALGVLQFRRRAMMLPL